MMPCVGVEGSVEISVSGGTVLSTLNGQMALLQLIHKLCLPMIIQ